MNYAADRSRLVTWLRKQLIGPAVEHELLRGIAPLDRYPTGRLFPTIRSEEGIDPASVGEDDDEDDFEAPGEDIGVEEGVKSVVKRRRYIPPSSVGFSFFARGDVVKVQVRCSAVTYRTEVRDASGQFRGNEYERIPHGGEAALTFTSTERVGIWPGQDGECLAGLDVLWRPFKDGWIITITLFNRQELTEDGTPKQIFQARNQKSLFEVGLSCFLEAGEVGTYPRVDYSLLNDEEQELELQYKYRHIYAVGHGAAVDWSPEPGPIREIRSEFMPEVEVPQVTSDVGVDGDQVLGLAHLADSGIDPKDLFKDLDRFVEGYSEWVSGQQALSENLDSEERAPAVRITDRMSVTVSRMRRGVSMLRADHLATQSFRLANQTMLGQMRQFDLVRGKVREAKEYKWRPFQLAFLLTVIESAIQEDDVFRDTVDLIWFPTGGGKTEAYLGLIAFLIVWRRLTHPSSGGGTTALMRYTLRLLTAQQYLRATRMICALELIRQSTPALGDQPITVGMWVGLATSPNTFEKAAECVQQASKGKTSAQRTLVLESCPWCGAHFTSPESYIASQTEFRFRCTNPECDFGQQGEGVIPCNVVDEALYKEPPTLLIATIDKFARLAWEERVSSFFGKSGNRPPELVIQDELHLIAGALGSVAGLYEASLDTILRQKGIYPKYIASTATIRMAAQQVERLYGRDLAVFPPPGLNCDDSYFARTVPLDVRSGRLYVGYLAPTLGNRQCMAPLAAALLAAPEAVFDAGQIDRDVLLEAWWTQVVYHGSLKGVGNSHNAFNIDVREFLNRLIWEAEEAIKRKQTEGTGHKERPIARSKARIAQLTSISSAEENARTFARLEIERNQPDCLDAVLATNMVSVGLDVGRLALMIINGQPLTTAEYIQASSRVGRSEVPGLVFANYFRDQARSLSHYENFRPYHDSFYRFVEPTSVTPFTYQARTRALHAALVIAIRHSCSHLLANNRAGLFDPSDDCVLKTIEVLKKRCNKADPGRKYDIDTHIDKLVEQWRVEVVHCRASKTKLDYQAPDNDNATRRLLYNHDDKIMGLWPTLQSMRNVEDSALLKSL